MKPNSLLGRENNNVPASFPLMLKTCKNSHDRLQKKLQQDELWTKQLFFVDLLWAPWALSTEAGGGARGGGAVGGLWFALEETRLDGLSAANLSDSKTHGLPPSYKSVSSPEGQDAIGPSLSCKGTALTNQHPSVFRSPAAWHLKQQLIERLVHFGFASTAVLLLFVLFVFLGSTHCFSASCGAIRRQK